MFSEWTVLVRHIVAGVTRATQQSICRPTTQEEHTQKNSDLNVQ
ncbi:hypothetical protein L915_00387 [Phytophthora nicotianae]|uniref:Uncharacterized protein n=1 Tax=Phytophthora nicotianae TaxID=4792 RepID=W2JX36_PHYNI|nr:hypothetical protein L915_00387 [Phytophthora nicotianae]ETL50357.1 hypothetical protein L916_00387 [Phytophthora nicotianae]